MRNLFIVTATNSFAKQTKEQAVELEAQSPVANNINTIIICESEREF